MEEKEGRQLRKERRKEVMEESYEKEGRKAAMEGG
jgi:hypothetical protein